MSRIYTYGEPNRDDWPTTLAAFRELFADRIIPKPRNMFAGTNIMTPDVLGFVRTGAGVAEIATGWGIDFRDNPAARIFGVTFPNMPHPDARSKCCHSWQEVASIVADPWQFPNDATRHAALALDNDRGLAEAVAELTYRDDAAALRRVYAAAGHDPDRVNWSWVAEYRAARSDEEGANR